jgi:hypothetical protein
VTSNKSSGSTGQLIQLCAGYFGFYVLTGVLVKYFTAIRQPPLSEMAYLFNNTMGGSVFALGVVFFAGWIHLKSNQRVKWGPWTVPSELAYIIPSGICTAAVIPTTTLMYTLPISVMVAMVIMRGSIIVISRLVDELQIRQGILRKRVYAEENWAVVFALLAVATNVLLLPVVGYLENHGAHVAKAFGLASALGKNQFDFIHNAAALTIMSIYIVAYTIRIYIMNYFKNTRARGVELDNQGFFAYEQIAASATMVLITLLVAIGPGTFGWLDERVVHFSEAVRRPDWLAVTTGFPYGAVAFFSVFIFMFKGRTATFAGLVNRLTSLVAGITSTLLLALLFGTKWPSMQDWASVLFILVAVWFLTRAEKRRTAELAAERATA